VRPVNLGSLLTLPGSPGSFRPNSMGFSLPARVIVLCLPRFACAVWTIRWGLTPAWRTPPRSRTMKVPGSRRAAG